MQKAQEHLIKLCKDYTKLPNFYEKVARSMMFYEHNGDEENHIKKLQFLFKSHKQAAEWLEHYAQHSTVSQPLHELCMYIEVTKSTFPHLNHFGKGNLEYLFKNPKKFTVLTRYHERFLTQDKIKQIKSTSIKVFIKQMIETLNQEQANAIQEKIGTLSEREKVNLETIRKINERFKRPLYSSADKILALMRMAKNSDRLLPVCTMKSEEFGLNPGYYITKLSEHDVRGAMLGYFLGCCQHIEGQGTTCVAHAISSEYGGTYVLFKGEISDDKKTTLTRPHKDKIIAGTWAWTDNQNVLMFDSIETTVDSDLITFMFKKYAGILLKRTPAHIRYVTVGTNGQTPSDLGIVPYHLLNVRNDQIYSDAREYRVIAGKDYPLTFEVNENNVVKLYPQLIAYNNPNLIFNLQMTFKKELSQVSIHFEPLKGWIDKLLNEGFMDVEAFLKDPTPALDWWIRSERATVAQLLFIQICKHGSFTEGTRNRIINHIKPLLTPDLCHHSGNHLDILSMVTDQNSVFPYLEAMLDRGADPNRLNKQGSPLLHVMLKSPISASLNITAKFIKKYKISVNQVDVFGRNILHELLLLPNRELKLFRLFLELGANPRLKETFYEHKTPIDYLLSSSDFLNQIPKTWHDEGLLTLTEEEIQGGVRWNSLLHLTPNLIAKGSLYEFFYHLYEERLAKVNTYEELEIFIENNHRPQDEVTGTKTISYLLRNINLQRRAPLLERLLKNKADPKRFIPQGSQYIHEIFSVFHKDFNLEWFDYFQNDDPEVLKKASIKVLASKNPNHSKIQRPSSEKKLMNEMILNIQAQIATAEDLEYLAKFLSDGWNPLYELLLTLARHENRTNTKNLDLLYQKYGSEILSKLLDSKSPFLAISEHTERIQRTGLDKFCREHQLPTPFLYCFELGHNHLKKSTLEDESYIKTFLKDITSLDRLEHSIFKIKNMFEKAADYHKKSFVELLIIKVSPLLNNHEDYTRLYKFFLVTDLFINHSSMDKIDSWLPQTLDEIYQASETDLKHIYDHSVSILVTLFFLVGSINTTDDYRKMISRISSLFQYLKSGSWWQDLAETGVFRKVNDLESLIQMIRIHEEGGPGIKKLVLNKATNFIDTTMIVPLVKDHSSYRLVVEFHQTRNSDYYLDQFHRSLSSAMNACIGYCRSIITSFPARFDLNVHLLEQIVKAKDYETFFKGFDQSPLLRAAWQQTSKYQPSLQELKEQLDLVHPEDHKTLFFSYGDWKKTSIDDTFGLNGGFHAQTVHPLSQSFSSTHQIKNSY